MSLDIHFSALSSCVEQI